MIQKNRAVWEYGAWVMALFLGAAGMYAANQNAVHQAETERQNAALEYQNAALERKLTEERHTAIVGLLGATGHAVIVLDKSHQITEWNAGAQRMFGWTKAEVVGTDASFLMPPELHAQHAAAFAQAMVKPKRDEAVEVLCEAMTKEGGKVDVRINVRLFPIGGEWHAYAIIDYPDKIKMIDARAPEGS